MIPLRLGFCFLTLIFSFFLVRADLGSKQVLYPNGLSSGFNLDEYIHPQTFYYSGADSSLCNTGACDNARVTAYFVSYPDNPTSFKICICDSNPVMDLGFMGFTFSKVPLPVRKLVKALTAASFGKGGGAGSNADAITFYDRNMRTEVFLHEAAHSFDGGRKSPTSEWAKVIDLDWCVPDDYAKSSYAEDYAQNLVVWVYMVVSRNTNNSFFNCLRNQVNYVARDLPPSSINATYSG